ncbi:hypothetical protein EW145_g7529 [Phellinidium pouzarii]|uniref:Uncharacterized protein n=1 Tax=Phellinidium pouzarii TaxID=167371 RepID=A0A4V3XAK2_9AGAM|nr:hypothetical protein EW145_g7529 [Phellinidium pouzarii]
MPLALHSSIIKMSTAALDSPNVSSPTEALNLHHMCSKPFALASASNPNSLPPITHKLMAKRSEPTKKLKPICAFIAAQHQILGPDPSLTSSFHITSKPIQSLKPPHSTSSSAITLSPFHPPLNPQISHHYPNDSAFSPLSEKKHWLHMT